MQKRRTTLSGETRARTTGEDVRESLPEHIRLACPKCNGRELDVEVRLTGSVRCEFPDTGPMRLKSSAEFQSEFPADGRCECLNCGWTGVSLQAVATSNTRLMWNLAEAVCD